MSRPIDVVLSRLEGYRLRPNGADRWRACCPAHGGSNPSALSVGIGADDAVLLKCWHGCDAHEVTQSLGLELSDLFPPRPNAGAGPVRRRGLLTAMQALELIDHEAQLIWVSGENIVAGISLTPADLDRVRQAAGRIGFALQEVRS